MTLGEHLVELRRRVLICAVALFVAGVFCFVIYNWILGLLRHPYCQVNPHHCGFYITGPLDGLTLRIQVSFYAGIIFALPVLFWELWRFITPGLKPTEKKYVVPFVLASVVLFLFGCLVAFLSFPHALGWLGHIGGPSLTQILDPNKYLSLILLLMLAFGVAFEFPVILVSLELADVISPKKLSSWRRWFIVGIVVVAGVITPSSDPFSMMAMAIPMYLFYELSILIGRIAKR
jgi:sec-independent protein translocase protein TatC